eukprot:12654010-Alexandrium_andersonii.AAC.1
MCIRDRVFGLQCSDPFPGQQRVRHRPSGHPELRAGLQEEGHHRPLHHCQQHRGCEAQGLAPAGFRFQGAGCLEA